MPRFPSASVYALLEPFAEEYKRLPKPEKKQVYFHRNVAKWLEQLNKPQQRKLYKAVKKEFGRK